MNLNYSKNAILELVHTLIPNNIANSEIIKTPTTSTLFQIPGKDIGQDISINKDNVVLYYNNRKTLKIKNGYLSQNIHVIFKLPTDVKITLSKEIDQNIENAHTLTNEGKINGKFFGINITKNVQYIEHFYKRIHKIIIEFKDNTKLEYELSTQEFNDLMELYTTNKEIYDTNVSYQINKEHFNNLTELFDMYKVNKNII